MTDLATRQPLAPIAVLDKFSHGLADGPPRTPSLATISAGYKTEQGYPQAVRQKDERWVHIAPGSDDAPGLRAALEAGSYRSLVVALPFDDPSLFLRTRFVRYSATRLEVFGDDQQLVELRVEEQTARGKTVQVPLPRQTWRPSDPEFAPLVETCAVAARMAFVLARWKPDGSPEVYFPDGLGAYDVRFTSRNSLFELVGSLEQLRSFTGGRIAGLPLRLAVRFREVADAGGMRRTVPVWTLRFEPPEAVELTPSSWAGFRALAAAEAELLHALPAPTEPTLEEAAAQPDADLDLPQSRQPGKPADVAFFTEAVAATVRGLNLEAAAELDRYVGAYSGGRSTTLAAFLADATDLEAAALVNHLLVERSKREDRATVERNAQRYTEIFGGEDDDLKNPDPRPELRRLYGTLLAEASLAGVFQPEETTWDLAPDATEAEIVEKGKRLRKAVEDAKKRQANPQVTVRSPLGQQLADLVEEATRLEVPFDDFNVGLPASYEQVVRAMERIGERVAAKKAQLADPQPKDDQTQQALV